MTSSLRPAGSTTRWRKIRAQVLQRDGGICWRCGRPGADSVDHVIPRRLGGGDEPWNLRAAHLGHNMGRGVDPEPEPSRQW